MPTCTHKHWFQDGEEVLDDFSLTYILPFPNTENATVLYTEKRKCSMDGQ